MSGVVKWQDPPADGRTTRGRAPGKYDLIAAELAEHPGEWAVVAECISASMCTHLRKRLAPSGIELVTRTRPEYARGQVDIYARHIGSVS